MRAPAAAMVLALLLLGCGEEEQRPNLLLVTIDSLRADALACYGGPEGVGDQICSVAGPGARYVWAFSPSPHSAPAVASILSSVYPSRHAVDASPASFLGEQIETLPELLRASGYRTGAFVGSPELNRSRNLRKGFDHYDDHTSSVPAGLPERRADELTDAALAWIGSTPGPWFAWVHYRDAHGPYEPPTRSPAALAQEPAGRGERLRVLPTATGRGGIPAYQAIPGLFTRQAYEARYRDEIRFVDQELGRLLEGVDPAPEEAEDGPRLGVAITADHGVAMGEDRYYFTHGHSLGLEQIRVPLLWRRPGAAGSERIALPVSTLDLAPTLLQAAGIGAPEAFEGRALPDESEHPGAPQLARAVFAERVGEVAVISGRHYYARRRDLPLEIVLPLDADALREAHAVVASLGDGPSPEALPPREPARPAGVAPLLEPLLEPFLAAEGAPADDPEAPPEVSSR